MTFLIFPNSGICLKFVKHENYIFRINFQKLFKTFKTV